jgi:multicomponent K+:H+ antiporter subunit F
MIALVTDVCLLLVALATVLCLVRLVRGPSVVDRAIALDTIAVNLMAIIVLISIRYNTAAYFDSVLVIAVLGFLGTVAIAKYLLKGDIID